MEKLKKYNQKLLAIIGSIAVLILFFSLCMITYEFARKIGRNWDYQTNVQTVNNIEETEEGKIRKQSVSFGDLVLIDSLTKTHLIPIGLKTLKDAEYLEEEEGMYAFMDATESSYEDYSYKKIRKGYSESGDFNNIVIYKQLTDSLFNIFNNKVCISKFEVIQIDNNKYIVLKVSSTDTNKDGKLDSDDFNSCFIYDLQELSLNAIEFKNMMYSSYDLIFDEEKIALYFYEDKDGNMELDYYSEPRKTYIYDLISKKHEILINSELENKLQKIVDGKIN